MGDYSELSAPIQLRIVVSFRLAALILALGVPFYFERQTEDKGRG